jgi:GNAT superfamily N-acetyltransferase
MELLYVLDIEPEMIVELWNETLAKRFPMTTTLWMQNTINDVNVMNEASIAFMENGELIGFVVAKRYQEHLQASMASHIGWIQCLLVKETARNRGIGTRMIQHVEKEFAQVGITEIRIGRDPWHYFPGVPKEDTHIIEWFEKNGYVSETVETDLMKSFQKSTPPYELTNSDEHYRVLTQRDLPELLQFLKDTFPGRWHYEAIHYNMLHGSGREFIGFFIQNELKGFCRINDEQSPVIAQNVYWSQLFDGTLGGIGPLGIERSIRGHQFGLDLVKVAVNELMNRQVDHIIIDWTRSYLYESLDLQHAVPDDV